MKRSIWMVGLGLVAAFAFAQQAGRDLTWAFPVPSNPQPPAKQEPEQIKIPGSTKSYTRKQIDDLTNPPDWIPEEHAPAPVAVKGEPGRKALGCGSCHLMSGSGHPGSADLAGLPAEYLVKQMEYFRDGTRKDTARMNAIAKMTTPEEDRQAAEYFAALKPQYWNKVEERATVPKTYVSNVRERFISPDGGTEPIGNRIITIPEDAEREDARDPHSGFIAYVPPGSIAKGAALAKGGNGKTISCDICHGEGLKGLGEVPRLANLHPIYIARQLYNIKRGTSNGKAVALMKRVVEKLDDDDILNLSAYVGSLKP
ncbi:MAG: c-type cytochrome [Bryobacteraceae bacterium]